MGTGGARLERARALLLRHPGLLAFGVLVALIAWLFSASLFGGKRLGPEDLLLFQSPFAPAETPAGWHPSNLLLFDSIYNFHPDMQYARAALRAFTLPTWNPYIGAGEPFLASQQHAIFFPLNWITVVAPFWSSLAWLAALKLLAAGAGTLLFLRTLRLRWPAALMGAVAFAFNAYLIDWLEHNLSNAWVVLPWLFFLCTRLARNRRPRDALLLGGAFGADFLGGHPETSFIAVTAVVPWFFALLAYERHAYAQDLRALARTVGLFAGAMALGGALAAIVVGPFIEMLGQSMNLQRSGHGGSNLLFGFVAPELWGRPDKAEIAGGPLNYLERTAYFGAIPVVLGIAGLVARRSKTQVFFAVIGLMSLGLAIRVPVYTHLVGGLPVLHRLNQIRYLGVVTFCGAVLAAYGLQHLLLERSTRRRLLMLLAGAATVAVPLLWVVLHRDVLHSFGAALEQLPNIQRGPIPRPVLQLATFMRWALFGSLGVALIAIAALKPRLALLAGVLAVAVTGYDLVSYNRGFHPAIPASFDEPPVPAALATLKQSAGHQRIAGGIEFLPNLAERYGLRDARIYELPELERRSRLWKALGGATGGDETMNPPENGLLASVFSVRYLLSYSLTEALLHTSHPGQWRALSPQPLVENREALPRAWIAYQWRSAPNLDRALSLMTAPTSTARVDMREPVVEGVASDAGEAPAPESARFLRDGEKDVAVSVDARRAGYLVLNDTYYPGWSATVDGVPATIHPANVAFRAVAVPAGRHVVAFRYDPVSVKLGALLSLLGLVVFVGGLSVPPLWRRRVRGRAQVSASAGGSSGKSV